MVAEGRHQNASVARARGLEKTYTRRVLAWYDIFVLGIVCRFVWRCSREHMLAAYNRNVGASHLDLGPGTGYFLDHCKFPISRPSIVLADLSEEAIQHAECRISRYQPVTVRADVLEPLDLREQRFDSVGMNMLLHCLPGDMVEKARVFDHVSPYLRKSGRIFGCTVLAHGVTHTRLAGKLLDSFNADETFHNRNDSLQDLNSELLRRFSNFRLWTQGSVAFFEVTI